MMDEKSWQNILEAEKDLGHATGIGRITRSECPLKAASPMACTFCSYGHMLDCHYPQTCEEAECSHYKQELEAEEDNEEQVERVEDIFDNKEDVLPSQDSSRPIATLCRSCGGVHLTDPPESYVDFRGYRFSPPFYCMCCGKEICARQFAFGRCCGTCDTGSCQRGNRAFRDGAVHGPPPWGSFAGDEGFTKFVDFAKAKKLTAQDSSLPIMGNCN